jgi:hypothetical protein
MFASNSVIVAGPILAASRSLRAGVHSAYRRWLDGMCSGSVVGAHCPPAFSLSRMCGVLMLLRPANTRIFR